MYQRRQAGSLLSDLTGWDVDMSKAISSSRPPIRENLGFDFNIGDLLSQTGDALKGALASQVLSDPNVQKTIQSQAEQTAVQKATAYVLAHKTEFLVGGLAAAALVGYAIFKK